MTTIRPAAALAAPVCKPLLFAALMTAAMVSGATAATGDRWAGVDSNGTLARNKGALEAVRTDVGRYIVTFDRRITNCIYVATIGRPTGSGVEEPAVISTRRRSGAGDKVQVSVFDSQGVAVDRGFFLHVVCQ
jgi:hypothetical protein